jgi:hypothetical protein
MLRVTRALGRTDIDRFRAIGKVVPLKIQPVYDRMITLLDSERGVTSAAGQRTL